jgi:hypothetical protein
VVTVLLVKYALITAALVNVQLVLYVSIVPLLPAVVTVLAVKHASVMMACANVLLHHFALTEPDQHAAVTALVVKNAYPKVLHVFAKLK